MKTLIKIIVANILLAVSSLAMADDMSLKIENLYVQITAGPAFRSGSTEFSSRFSAGVDLNKRLGIEAGATTTDGIFSTEYNVLYMNIVARHVLTEKVTLGAKVGVTDWESSHEPFFFGTKTEENGFSGMLGAELKYDFSASLAAVLSMDFYGTINIAPVTAGLRYTF